MNDDEVPQAPTPPKPTESVTLNLADPNKADINVNIKENDGVSVKEHFPNSGHHIGSVVDGKAPIWKAEEGSNERCKFVESYEKGGSTLITIGINKGDDYKLNSKYFGKEGKEWNIMQKDDFFNKLDKMSELPKTSQ